MVRRLDDRQSKSTFGLEKSTWTRQKSEKREDNAIYSRVGVVRVGDLRAVGVVRVGDLRAVGVVRVGVVRVGDLRAVGVVDDSRFAVRVGVVEGGSAADLAVEQFSAPRKLGNMIATVQVLSLAAVRGVAEKHLPSLCGPNNQPTDYTADVVQKRHLYVCVEPSRLCAWRMEVSIALPYNPMWRMEVFRHKIPVFDGTHSAPRGEWKFLGTKCRFLTAPIRHHVGKFFIPTG